MTSIPYRVERAGRCGPARSLAAASTAVLSLGLLVPAAEVAAAELSPIEALGKAIFFDEGVSLRGNQACATCRVPAAGWVGNDSAINAAGAIYE